MPKTYSWLYRKDLTDGANSNSSMRGLCTVNSTEIIQVECGTSEWRETAGVAPLAGLI